MNREWYCSTIERGSIDISIALKPANSYNFTTYLTKHQAQSVSDFAPSVNTSAHVDITSFQTV